MTTSSEPGRSGATDRATRRAGPFRWLRLGRSPGRSARASEDSIDPAALESALRAAVSQTGESLFDLSLRRPRLTLFLRHLGCVFCRESLAELFRARQGIERAGVGIVLVHMARDDGRAERLFSIYDLAEAPRIADPERRLYRALGLGEEGRRDLLNPRVLLRTIEATCRGHLPGRRGGDTSQMPGVFLIHRGRIVEAFRHRTVADRPDYVALATPAAAGTAP